MQQVWAEFPARLAASGSEGRDDGRKVPPDVFISTAQLYAERVKHKATGTRYYRILVPLDEDASACIGCSPACAAELAAAKAWAATEGREQEAKEAKEAKKAKKAKGPAPHPTIVAATAGVRLWIPRDIMAWDAHRVNPEPPTTPTGLSGMHSPFQASGWLGANDGSGCTAQAFPPEDEDKDDEEAFPPGRIVVLSAGECCLRETNGNLTFPELTFELHKTSAAPRAGTRFSAVRATPNSRREAENCSLRAPEVRTAMSLVEVEADIEVLLREPAKTCRRRDALTVVDQRLIEWTHAIRAAKAAGASAERLAQLEAQQRSVSWCWITMAPSNAPAPQPAPAATRPESGQSGHSGQSIWWGKAPSCGIHRSLRRGAFVLTTGYSALNQSCYPASFERNRTLLLTTATVGNVRDREVPQEWNVDPARGTYPLRWWGGASGCGLSDAGGAAGGGVFARAPRLSAAIRSGGEMHVADQVEAAVVPTPVLTEAQAAGLVDPDFGSVVLASIVIGKPYQPRTHEPPVSTNSQGGEGDGSAPMGPSDPMVHGTRLGWNPNDPI